MRFSICAEMLFSELPFAQRLERIRAAGFDAFEFWAWRDKEIDLLEAQVRQGLAVATFSGQRRGSLVDPRDLELYARELREALPVARRLGCGQLMVLSDELSADGSVQADYPPLSAAQRQQNIIDGLRQLAPLAEEAGVTLLLEPLNTQVDHPGYALSSTREGRAIVDAVASPRVKLLYDVYHMQIMEGNVIATLEANLVAIGHIHVADVPGRHEPGTGELNYARILGRLAELGYRGFVGFELSPAASSERALDAIAGLRRGLHGTEETTP